MIDLYTWTTPNGRKVSILLEETGLDYTVHPVNLSVGAQFAPEFLTISPNNKIPAIIDRDGPAPVPVFESGAILLYLAEKAGQFLPTDPAGRATTLQWLMWQMAGLGPMLGQANHFASSAPERVPYALDRFLGESARLFKVLDGQLAKTEFVAGAYSIADMAIYPWAKAGFSGIRAAKPDDLGDGLHIARWLDAVASRPAVQRGMAVPDVPAL